MPPLTSRTLTRRDILTAFLGMPIALAACRAPQSPLSIEGRLIGPSDTIGHRLRDRRDLPVPIDRWQSVGVVIIGAGMAGLSAAWRLRRAGYEDFVVLELEHEPGGTSRSGRTSEYSYPWGAHYLPVPMRENTLLLSLLEEMGIVEDRTMDGEPIVGEQYLCRDPQERLYYRGRWYEGLYLFAGASAEDLAQFAAFKAEIDRWVAWRDRRGRRAFAIPLATGSDDAEITALDKITMSEWLDRYGWNSSRLRWVVNYGCRDDYGLTIEQTSAWAGIFYFAARVRKPGDDAQPLMTWPEGNGRLVSYLYNLNKEKVQLGSVVTNMNPTGTQETPHVEVTALDHATQTAVGFRAQKVIFAAPQFLAPYLIQPYRETPPSHLRAFSYGSWFVANMFLKGRPAERGFPLAWDNVLYDSPSLGYVAATHQRGLDYGPTVLTYYYPFCDPDVRTTRMKLLAMDWQTCSDIVLSDLQRPHRDIRSLAERIDIMRWGHAMVQPRPGFVWSEARRKATQPFRGIHFASTDLSGVALCEEAFSHGVRAAEEVLAASGELKMKN